MSQSNSSGPQTAESLLITDEYDAMLADLDAAIDDLRQKIEDGRVRDEEKEKVRVKQWRAMGYLIRTRSDVVEQRSLEELHERVERMEQTQRGQR